MPFLINSQKIIKINSVIVQKSHAVEIPHRFRSLDMKHEKTEEEKEGIIKKI